MISLQIKNTRDFMSKFLASDIFDKFLLDSAELKLGITYNIDGHVNKAFYSESDESELPAFDFSAWSEIRPKCFDLIKGKRTPLSFKFVMCTSPDKKNELLSSENFFEVKDQLSSFVFVIKYSEGHVVITTGAALSGFVLDKSYEKVWDDYIKSFLTEAQIDFDLDY
ncbi:MAG: hypothetical protein E7302_10660 [Butyrivibrio sp.]|nr:hypothetical protein [Butyrivibrio sp.]